MIVLLAICMGGLEELAKEQLELAGAYTVEILPSSKINLTSKTSNIHRGEAGVGKLKVEIFESQKEKNEIINNNDNKYCINFETLYSKVKMIQYWMIYVNHYTDISNNTDDVLGIKIQKTKKLKLSTEEKDEEKEEIITEEERDGGYLYDNLIKLDYSYYLKQWQKCLQNNSFEEINDENENENSSSSTSSISTYLSPSFEPRFTLRCIRDGNHEYNSLDFSKRLGDIINEKTNWKIDLINMNLEIITFLLNEILIIGFNIPINPKKKFIKNKLPCETKLSILELSALKVLENEEYYEQNQNKNKNEKNIVENELEKKRKFKLKGLPLLNPPLIYENLTKLPAIALRPSTAASFLVLSQPKLGDVLLDFNYAEGSITSDHIHDYFNLKFSSNKFSSTLPPCILLTGCPDYNLHNVLNRTLSIMNNQKKIADVIIFSLSLLILINRNHLILIHLLISIS